MRFIQSILSVSLLTVVTAASAATVTEAVQAQPENIFYRSGAEGWYWYQDPPKEEELPQQPEVKPEPKPAVAAKPAPAPFTLKWVQEMLPKYRERAWDNPTQENVQAYFLVQRFAMDRATQFADVAQQVVVGNAMQCSTKVCADRWPLLPLPM